MLSRIRNGNTSEMRPITMPSVRMVTTLSIVRLSGWSVIQCVMRTRVNGLDLFRAIT